MRVGEAVPVEPGELSEERIVSFIRQAAAWFFTTGGDAYYIPELYLVKVEMPAVFVIRCMTRPDDSNFTRIWEVVTEDESR